jgi:HSP20 family protein
MAQVNNGGLVRKEKMRPAVPFTDMEKYFDSFFRNPLSLMAAPILSSPVREDILTPSVDIYNDGDDLVLKAEVPGISRDDLDISFDRNVLTISGEKKQESKVEEKDYHRIERSYGSFTRSFKMPEDVNVDKAKAAFTDGILEIRVPRSGENKPKKIAIK